MAPAAAGGNGANGADERGWTFGRPFVVRYCRVGVLNAVGELLDPAVVVLLIGERPGLATAESLSAYLAYRPRRGHTDAQRNLISNIHARGVSTPNAALRIINLAATMMTAGSSGYQLREDLSPSAIHSSRSSGENAMLWLGHSYCAAASLSFQVF